MNSQFYGRSGLETKTTPTPSHKKRAGWLVVAIVFLALVAGGAIYGYSQLPDPEVARLEEKGKELFQPPQPGEAALTPQEMEQRHEQFQEYREEVEQLEESQQDKLRRGFVRMFRAHMQAEVERYQTLSDAEKIAFLDEKIDQMESRRQWGERQRQAGEGGERPGPPGGGPPGGPPPGGEGGSPPNPEERQERFQQFRREFISDTTPEERAQMGLLMEDMNARREERGLERMPDFGER